MRPRKPIPISYALPIVLGLLIVGTMAPVILSAYLINRSNAGTLLGARAELLVDGLENQLRGLLDPVADQFAAARDHIEETGLVGGDPMALEHFMEGVLMGAPQLTGIGILRADGTMRRWEVGHPDAIEEPAYAIPFYQQALDATQASEDTVWAAPFVSQILGDVILNPRIRLDLPDGTTGALVGVVTAARLSDYVSGLSDELETAFILYERTGLIAYPGRGDFVSTRTTMTLPTLADSSDPVLRDMWAVQNPLTQTTRMTATQGHWSWIGDEAYGYLYRDIAGYGPGNLVVGVAIASSESWLFRWASALSAGIGGVLLALALWIAYRLSRRIARPFVQFDQALGKLREMDFDAVNLSEMQRSPVAELATSADRLMLATRALARMHQYVPRALGRKLMEQPEAAAQASERDVTVMFIDLEGFSRFARQRSAAETAAWLNDLFGRVGPLIEATGGVIDKYTGDGLMAFWGAPDAQPDHLDRAIAAAKAISAEVQTGSRRSPGHSAPRMRIGVHTGPAIVGNLGFEGRINYTLVGQTVNTAERVEQGLRGQDAGSACVIGLSGQAWARLGAPTSLTVVAEVDLDDDRLVVVRQAGS